MKNHSDEDLEILDLAPDTDYITRKIDELLDQLALDFEKEIDDDILDGIINWANLEELSTVIGVDPIEDREEFEEEDEED